MNFNKEYLDSILAKMSIDQKMWGGIGVFSVIMIVLFSLFTGSAFLVAEKIGAGLLEMVVPGYVIVKLFLNDMQVTENRALDRFILSLGISIAIIIPLAFVTEYITIFGFNEDQDERIARESYKAIIIVLFVIGAAFGAKYLPTYLPKYLEEWKAKKNKAE